MLLDTQELTRMGHFCKNFGLCSLIETDSKTGASFSLSLAVLILKPGDT